MILDLKAQRKFVLDKAKLVLIEADEQYRRVIITKDLTPVQREERREKIKRSKANKQSNQNSSGIPAPVVQL